MKSNSQNFWMLVALMLTSLAAFAYFCAWNIGITPANQGEREFITMLEKSSFSEDVRVKAAVAVANDAAYISRRHFFKAETAFQAASAADATTHTQSR